MGVQQFEATAEIFNRVRVVAVRGEFDIATSPQVRELLADAATDPAHPVVIDLARCDFIDSTRRVAARRQAHTKRRVSAGHRQPGGRCASGARADRDRQVDSGVCKSRASGGGPGHGHVKR